MAADPMSPRRDFVQHARERVGGELDQDQADDNTDQDQQRALPDNDIADTEGPRSQRQANGQLACPEGDGPREQTVDSDRGKQARQRAEEDQDRHQ